MKKLIVVLVFLFAATALFGQSIQVPDVMIGKWLDHNYDAVWDFSTTNIRILSTSGEVIFDFRGRTIKNFAPLLENGVPGVTFSCDESARTYRFLKPVLNTDLILEIDRTNLPRYNVTMKKQ